MFWSANGVTNTEDHPQKQGRKSKPSGLEEVTEILHRNMPHGTRGSPQTTAPPTPLLGFVLQAPSPRLHLEPHVFIVQRRAKKKEEFPGESGPVDGMEPQVKRAAKACALAQAPHTGHHPVLTAGLWRWYCYCSL